MVRALFNMWNKKAKLNWWITLLREGFAGQTQSLWVELTADLIKGFLKHRVQRLVNFYRYKCTDIIRRSLLALVILSTGTQRWIYWSESIPHWLNFKSKELSSLATCSHGYRTISLFLRAWEHFCSQFPFLVLIQPKLQERPIDQQRIVLSFTIVVDSPDNSLSCATVLYIVECLTASLVLTYKVLSCDNQNVSRHC